MLYPAENAGSPKSDTEALHFLIVDDSPSNSKLVEVVLRKMGHTCEVATNGREAVARYLETKNSGKRFNMILMDLQMPILNGLEASREIRQNSVGYQPVIVAITANCQDQDRRSAKRAGMDDFLAKPIRIQTVRDLVDRWANRGGSTDLPE